MEKHKQWIAVGIAVVVAVVFGVLIYMQFSQTEDMGLRGELQRQAEEARQAAETSDTGGFETGTLPEIPAGAVSIDDVVSGIEDAVEAEEDLLDAEATAETGAFSDEGSMFNEYDEIYEQTSF